LIACSMGSMRVWFYFCNIFHIYVYEKLAYNIFFFREEIRCPLWISEVCS
jgi:hypothetical protein